MLCHLRQQMELEREDMDMDAGINQDAHKHALRDKSADTIVKGNAKDKKYKNKNAFMLCLLSKDTERTATRSRRGLPPHQRERDLGAPQYDVYAGARHHVRG